MAIVFTLVDATQYRLRYLATQDGVISSPPVETDGFNTIPNDAGVTPDLQTDILTASAGGGGGMGGIPLQKIIKARIDGFGPLAAGVALTQAQARAIMNSDDAASAVLTNQHVGRAVTTSSPRLGLIDWAVDINVDGQGDPVVEVRSEVGTAATCYVDIHYRHTDDL